MARAPWERALSNMAALKRFLAAKRFFGRKQVRQWALRGSQVYMGRLVARRLDPGWLP